MRNLLIDPGKDAAGEPYPVPLNGVAAATVVSAAALAKAAPFKGGNTGAQIGTAYMVGALIDASAADTQKKAESFHEKVIGQMPGLDLRTEFSTALQDSLKSKGIQTILVKDSINAPSRLRWPVDDADTDGKALPVAAGNLPTIDADLLVQYSPVAVYLAGGALNNYRVRAIVGIAMYNARTKEFLGRQNFVFTPNMWRNEFITYASLESSIDKAIPAVRAGLMSLVPEIVGVISKEPVRSN